MPVLFAVAAHSAKLYTFPDGRFGHTADDALAKACKNQHTKHLFPPIDVLFLEGTEHGGQDPDIVPNRNGFVGPLLDAYTQGLQLLRERRAELLRANFVSHEGKKELLVYLEPETRYTVDFRHMARLMAGLIEKNVVDPTLRA
ncbi:hypothetical protein DFH08DRAFT_964866 [Mycena albidolilacea]|uniref:Uncharacterized protein n=1 Tax=Mycena albidolilacea TaxID=1033008 RepID=A0AAD6ZSE0_9AGAR|nr:hypothetical protein DFH08DRAFT_964866 [Mycena albidolilacea]